MAERSVSIRLGTSGKADVTRTFDEIALSGDASAKRLASSYERASEEVEAAMRRQANAAAKIAAITPQTSMQMRVNDAAGTGFGQYEGSARQSASAFRELLAEQEKLESRTRALVAAIDPAFGAQQRFNREVGEARSLVSAGAISLDQYCAKLRIEQAALDAATGAQGRAEKSARSHSAALTGLSYQAQDAFTQISMGANPLNVLAIQGAQAAGQMANMEGKVGAVASVLAGPWGLAASGGLLLLGALTDHFLKAGDAADAKKASVKSLTESIDDLNQATGRQIKSEQTVQQETLRSAAALRQQALDTRTATIEKIKLARANLSAALATENTTGGTVPGATMFGRGTASREVELRQLGALLAKNEADLAKANVTFRQAEIPVLQRRVAEAFDKSAAATGRYERAVDGLNARYAAGKVSQASYNAELSKLTATRDRDTEAARKGRSASSAMADADAAAASASTEVQRAQANLAKVRASARAELRAGTITEAEYTARVADAQRAVDSARESTREHAKATRDAAAAQRDLAVDLASVVKQLDPARAAAEEYRETLAKIAALQGAGKLGIADATGLTQEAIDREEKRRDESRQAKFKATFGSTDLLGEMVSGIDRQRKIDVDTWNAEFERRQQKQEESVRTVAGLYQDLMTGGVSSIWNRFQQMGLNVITELLAKWTANKLSSSIPQLASLFGKAPGKNAAGTDYWSGGTTWIAENGPEIVSLPAGSRITPANETRRLLAGNDNGGRGGDTHVHVYAQDAVLAETVRGWVAEGVQIGAARGAAGGAAIAAGDRAATGRRRLGRFG